MPSQEADKLFVKGLNALTQGRTLSALSWFEKAVSLEPTPLYISYFAYCIAKERGQFKKARSLCEESIRQDSGNSAHYLNLGKILLLTGNKEEAVKVFREGLGYENNTTIVAELDRLITRKPPVLPFLERENLLNKYVGFVLTKLGIR
ncbi:MAG: tetratricopeptide repeat protein [Alphaproteobacteria bacterium]|uniref:Tetratricopeptide repeat protein n=1 Tax=Candidatus Nitrobium versatile TaxID=2884831 RepID=A0A953LWP5_9BACT|nr:tetratricopeptide repeat protein [Candidatus Nitrobium versatile]